MTAACYRARLLSDERLALVTDEICEKCNSPMVIKTGRFGRFLGRGLTLEQAVEAMQGATLECLGIIAVMREATRGLRARGEQLELPLLDHMAEVVLDGAPVDMPFARFFG